MKMNVCDVCLKNKKIVKARYRVGWSHGIKIDLCVEHKDFIDNKTQEEVGKWLYNGED